MGEWQRAEQHVDRALAMFERGRWAEAEAELRKALEIDPQQGDWHFNLGLILDRSDRDAEALACFEQASRLLPEAAEPRMSAGASCIRMGRFNDAIDWLEASLILERDSEPTWAMLITAQTHDGDFDAAETSFYLAQDALAEQGSSVLLAMSECLELQELWDRAAWCAREALRIDPDAPGGQLRLASVLVGMGDSQQAAQLLLRALRDDPGNIQALLLHADVLTDAGRHGEALLRLHRVLELEPANVDAHVRAGELALDAGRFEEAFIAWGLVRRLDPSHRFATVRMAETLLGMDRPTLASPLLHEHLDLWESSMVPSERLRVSELLLQAGEHATVISLLEDHAPLRNNVEALRLLAVAMFQSGRMDEGAVISRRVLRTDNRCVASMQNLAIAAMAGERYRAAWGWMQRGLAVNPQDAQLRRLRSRLIWLAIGRRLKKWR
ncbi:MAG: tetratricopeptide repeat protein [Phycisphaerales bacterium]|nr:tetratricopeptide repeat protein [Phycisphaerales bacterium]